MSADDCCACEGRGARLYPNTGTWHAMPGGVYEQAVTQSVCDACWGSGSVRRKGVDIRVLYAQWLDARRSTDAAYERIRGLFGKVAAVGLKIDRDGDMWFARFGDFVNLQESVAAFGETKESAFDQLAENYLADRAKGRA